MLRAIRLIRQAPAPVASYCTGHLQGVESFRVFVTNLPWTVGDQQLTSYFAQFGPVLEARVAYDRPTGLSRGFGFVKFRFEDSVAAAKNAEKLLLDGKLLSVEEVYDD